MKADWEQSQFPLTPEEVIQWLEGHRQLMFEIWTQNPKLREEWERINLPASSAEAPRKPRYSRR